MRAESSPNFSLLAQHPPGKPRARALWSAALFLCSLSLVCAPLTQAQSPFPDSFNPGANDWVDCLAVQPDGRILAGGQFTSLGTTSISHLARLSPEGILETSFNPAGANGFVSSLALQPDGKIVVAGGFSSLGSSSRLYIGRLNRDGTVDAGFNPGATGYLTWVSTVAVQSDGKILVGGNFYTLGGASRSFLGRLESNGVIDTNFNPGASDVVRALAIQPDGKILVGGSFTNLAGQIRCSVGRLNADGTLDTSFNPGANNNVSCFALQPDGKILVGGAFTTLAGTNCGYLGRLNADGSLDPGFNPQANGAVNSIALQTDGRILVGGTFTSAGGQARTNLARLNPDGTADPSFSSGANNPVYVLTVQPDGKILAGGGFTTLSGQSRSRLGRLNNTESATGSLALQNDTLTWLRSGNGPELWRVSFESWDGFTWSDLGPVTRIAGGWQLSGLSLATNATLRAHGHVACGLGNASGWFVEDGLGPIVITSPPASQTNNPLTTAMFSVAAPGAVPMTYQWLKNGTALGDGGNLLGATTPVLALTNVLGADMGAYAVVVSNRFGSATSAVATLTVIDPLITSQPTAASVNPGTNVTFRVGATGTMPLNYQWRREGVPLAGATNATLSLTNLQAKDAGNYDALVSNAFGSITSQVALLTVNLVETNFNPGAQGTVYAFALQADGRIVVGGNFITLGNSNRTSLGRLNADGTVDGSFNPGAGGGSVNCLAVQPDGKILAAGSFTTLGGLSRASLGRLNVNGSVDASFNPGANNTIRCLSLQPDGKLLVGGNFTRLGGQSCTNLGRLNADGTLDSAFNPGVNGAIYSLALQPDGKILTGGSFTVIGGAGRTNLARLNAEGTLDSSFAAANPAFNPGYSGYINCLLVQPDGKILAGGSFSTIGGVSCPNLARLNSDGTVDDSFTPGVDGGVASLALQADGKIVLCGGFTRLSGQYRPYLGRLNADGSVDSTFNCSTSYYTTYALAIQTDGKILVGGGFTSLGGISRASLGRLNNPTPVLQSLTLNQNTLTWLRGGSSPEIQGISFESWNGTAWANLGPGTRVDGGWQLSGLSLPAAATVRGRGYVAGGEYNGSSWPATCESGALVVVGQPVSRTNNAGTVATFTASALGETPNWQWLKNGMPLTDGGQIAGAATSTLTLSNVLGGNMGGYAVLISNSFGSITSAVATLKVIDPYIVTQPFSQYWWANSNSISFRVAVAGTSPMNYQWRKDGLPVTDGGNLSGATNSVLTLASVFGPDQGGYSVVVSNAFGCVTSSVATLTVVEPWIVNQPVSQNVSAGNNATFCLTVRGTSPLLYQWRREGAALSGATNSVLTLTNLQSAEAGAYDVVVSNAFGSVTSVVARLTVNLVRAETNFAAGANGPAIAFAVQPDGKIVVGGNFTTLGGLARTNLARLNADGTLDTAFNPGANNPVLALVAQDDGKIVVGGRFTNLGGQNRTNLARLNSDGTVDNTFNPGANNEVYCLAAQADGKILAGGYFTMLGGQSRSRIGRLNPDGTVDDAFNPGASNAVWSLAVQSDGKILVGGFFTTLAGANRSYLGRLNADGTLDAGFTAGANSNINCLAVQPDGKILAGGGFTILGNGTRNFIGRLNADGSLDATFNPGANDWVYSLGLQADGKILACGRFTNLAGETRSYIGRLNSDGTPDPRFNPGANGFVYSLAVQPDGRILASGFFTGLEGQACTYIARLSNTEPATQNLCATADALVWRRGGTSPEVGRTTFELWEGGTWTRLGEGTWTGSGWQLSGFPLVSNATIRVRGYVTGGQLNGSVWFVETAAAISPPPRFELTSAPPTLGPDGFRAQVNHLTGQGRLIIYASTNLTDWLPVLTNPAGPLQFEFLDPEAPNLPRRFYRAAEER